MKLIDEDKLLGMIPDLEKYPGQLIHVSGSEFKKKLSECLVDPTDLELAVWGAWKELRARVVAALATIFNNDASRQKALEEVYGDIEALESALDPEKWRKIREEAAAWKILWDEHFDAPGLDWNRDIGFRNSALAQAQAELAKEKGEDHDAEGS